MRPVTRGDHGYYNGSQTRTTPNTSTLIKRKRGCPKKVVESENDSEEEDDVLPWNFIKRQCNIVSEPGSVNWNLKAYVECTVFNFKNSK